MKGVWAMVIIIGALLLQGGAARHRQYFASNSSPSLRPPPPGRPPTTDNCTKLTQMKEGPYWIDENIEAVNVRAHVRHGVPLNITFKIVNETLSVLQGTCVPIAHARIDIWQCSYDGLYSDEEEFSTLGERWLRGYQYTNSTGHASFHTIYPGWYKGRTTHIHLRVRIYEADGNTTLYDDTTQIYFDDTASTAIFNDVYPYNIRSSAGRHMFNNNDPYFRAANLLTLIGSYNDTDGYSSVVEMSLPFSSYSPMPPHGKSTTTGAFIAIS